MTETELRSALLDALASVAPEADLAHLDPTQALRDELEIDSMDFLGFVVAVHRRTGVEIPEADYPKLATLDSAVSYLEARLARAR
jgi:acyl carrier protein